MATSSPAKQPSDRSLAKDSKGGTRDARRTQEPLPRTSCLGGLVGGSTPVVQITDVEVYYGTMFGAAERYARALAHELTTQRRLRVVVHDLDAFDDATFVRHDRLGPARLFVMVVSTHFAGMPAPSAERFRDWINAAVANPRKVHECKPAAGSSRSLCTVAMNSATAQHKSFWAFRRRKAPLRGMQYAVFGVGDSVYLTFNAVGKLVDLKLKKLGAVRFHPLGLGDCSNDIDGTFQQWQTALLAKLPMASAVDALAMARGAMAPNAVAPSPLDDQTEESLDDATGSTGPTRDSPIRVLDNFGGAVVLEFRCRVLLDHEVDNSQLFTLYPSMASRSASSTSTGPSSRTASFPAGPRTPRIALFDRAPFAKIEAVELRPGYGGEPGSRRAATFCVHLLDPETTYVSVSTLAIFPQNSLDYITRVAEAFAFDLDAIIELTPLPCDDDAELQQQRLLQLPFPTPCTVRTMLTEFLELRTVTREFVRAAAGFVVTSDERAMLEHLGSTEGSADFRTQIVEPFKGILELIAMAPTLQIPLEVFVNITPPLKPRFFSIASSPIVMPHEVEIAVSMGVADRPHGLCVSFLERILSQPQGTRVPFRGFVSWSRFQFSDDGVSPMVCIAMGVGLSAMRSIIQERLARWLETQRHGSHVGATSTRPGNRTIPATQPTLLLFLGAATTDHVVFRHDLNHWEQQMMVKVHYAFSNDPRHARRRVHEVVASRMGEIVDAMKSSNGSRLFVCGRVTLVHRIREMFEADQVRRGSRWFDALVASGRFIDEGFN